MLSEMPPLVADIVLSLDDKYLYFSNWLRGGWEGRWHARESVEYVNTQYQVHLLPSASAS